MTSSDSTFAAIGVVLDICHVKNDLDVLPQITLSITSCVYNGLTIVTVNYSGAILYGLLDSSDCTGVNELTINTSRLKLCCSFSHFELLLSKFV
jgi:hypothetical protein